LRHPYYAASDTHSIISSLTRPTIHSEGYHLAYRTKQPGNATMASPLSCSRRGRGWPQKLCVVLLILSIHVVHGKDSKPKKGASPKKGQDKQKDKKGGGSMKDLDKKVLKEITKNMNKKELKNFNKNVDKIDPKDLKKLTKNMNEKEVKKFMENVGNKKKKTTHQKKKIKKEVRNMEEFKPDKDKKNPEKDQELEDEMTFVEFEYDLKFLDTERKFERDEEKILANEFKSTYNEMFSDWVVLKAKVNKQTLEEEDGANRLLSFTRRTSWRSIRLSMRLRAVGPNKRARDRPLLRTQANRLLSSPAVRGTIAATPTEASLFIKAFDKKFLKASESGIFQHVHSDVPTLLHTNASHINPTETLFPFETSLTFSNVLDEIPVTYERETMDNFQQAYNDHFNTSLVVNVKNMTQQLIPRNETIGTNETVLFLDVVCTFTGTCYTDDEVEAEEQFAQIESLAAWATTPGVKVGSERNFFNLLNNGWAKKENGMPPGLAKKEKKMPSGLGKKEKKMPSGVGKKEKKIPSGLVKKEKTMPSGLAEKENTIPSSLVKSGKHTGQPKSAKTRKRV